MSDPADSIQAQLAALRQGFVDQLPQRIATIEAAHAAWSRNGSPNLLGEYHRLVHSLTGAGATFGYDRISQLARYLERYLKQLLDVKSVAITEYVDEASVLLNGIRAEALGLTQLRSGLTADLGIVDATPLASDQRLVYLLENDETREAARQLLHFGYDVKSYRSGATLQLAVDERRPAMILADIALFEGAQLGIEVVAAIQRQQLSPIPVLFFSNYANFDARLAAVRAGGVAYLQKPLSIEKLVDVMDGLVTHDSRDPPRVLVVDDQFDQGQRNALILRQAGIVVEVTTNSMKIFNTLAEFSPELILMDTCLLHCNGVELAAMIRQQPGYVAVPILFLSSEREQTLQLDAMRISGDDLLASPVNASELVQAVTIRADRYRTLRSLMSHDSLTGVLNHSHIMASLDQEVARATRYGASLSFAMLDIDQFKQVNDTYGHDAGDAVIKSLTRLLQQRLRKSDAVGRYGGEEFAVIMPETPLASAARVMDDVRQLFSEIIHQAGDETFSVTLSCGVATAQPVAKSHELQELANKRLYCAKQSGRNQVVSSDS